MMSSVTWSARTSSNVTSGTVTSRTTSSGTVRNTARNKGRQQNARLVTTQLAPTSAKPITSDKISDRLFSKTSLRCITAMNIREKENLHHVYRSIDNAVRTTNADFEHQTKAMRRKGDWLRSKLHDRSWRRLLAGPGRSRSEPPPGDAYGDPLRHLLMLPMINVERDVTGTVPPRSATEAWGQVTPAGQRHGVTFASQLATYGDERYNRLDQPPPAPQEIATDDPPAASTLQTPPQRRTLTMEDIQRLVLRIYRPTSTDPDVINHEERRLVDFLCRMVNQIEQEPSVPGRSHPGTTDGDVLTRLSTALGADLSAFTERSSISSDPTDEKRRRYLERMTVRAQQFPPIYASKPSIPQQRDWDITETTGMPPKLSDREWMELHYCRYLRQAKMTTNHNNNRDGQ